jgi:hypothetical protein
MPESPTPEYFQVTLTIAEGPQQPNEPLTDDQLDERFCFRTFTGRSSDDAIAHALVIYPDAWMEVFRIEPIE